MSVGPGKDRGTNLPGPLYTHTKPEAHVATTVPRRGLRSLSFRNRFRSHPHYFEEFDGQATVPASVATVATGTPTGVAIVADAVDGQISATLAATAELEVSGISWGDQRVIPGNSLPLFQTLSKVSTIAANQDAVWGLISDYNATLASITTYAWFRLSASMVLTFETNDGTTATLAQLGEGVTLTAATFYLFTVDLSRRFGRAQFFLGDNLVADLPWTALPTTTLQPFVAVRKASGTGTPAVTVDYWTAEWQRTNLPFGIT